MNASTNKWLIAAAIMSVGASVIHVATIFGGGDWYRFFGAGEQMARLDESGSMRPAVMTAFIAMILAGWALYALSGAGVIPRLPLARTALVLITTVLSLRIVMGFFPVMFPPEVTPSFIVWSSLIVALMAAVFAIGTAKAWPRLSRRSA
jgi:hypothetical protein